jgi:hypothetical protein
VVISLASRVGVNSYARNMRSSFAYIE